MLATVSFPSDAGTPAAGPFTFSDIAGLRIASAYAPGAAIGDRFSVSFAVAREEQAPDHPGPLEKSGEDITRWLGRKAKVEFTYPGVLSYSFNEITFEQCHTPERVISNQRRRVGLFGFRYSSATPLINCNTTGSSDAVKIEWLNEAVAPPVATGTFHIGVPEQVASAAIQAANGAPTIEVEGAKTAIVLQAPGKGLAFQALAKSSNPLGAGQAGVLSIQSHRDSTNDWLKAILIQNCAQSPPPDGGGNPQAQGGLELTVNGRAWTGTTLTGATVSAYLVEEVWGWFKHLPQLTDDMVIEMFPIGGGGAGVDSWLLPRASDLRRFDALQIGDGVVNPGLERVSIRFQGGLTENDFLFA